MLTIGQLAAYTGVTVRAVRHYHARGLLPEPERDHSGYRTYDAASVVRLVRIRTLAEAGVPLARVAQLLEAGEREFAEAVLQIDRRLRSEILARRRHRERIALLAAGDSLALPPEAVAYLDRLRLLGFDERFVAGERDAWILVAARLPEQMPAFMQMKQGQLDDPESLGFYRDMAELIDGPPDLDRLRVVADRLAALLDADAEAGAATGEAQDSQQDWDAALVELLDSFFLDSFPGAPLLMGLLEERGWRGWTRLERIEAGRR